MRRLVAGRLAALGLALLVAACGGGGGGSSSSVAPAPAPTPVVNNTAAIVVDNGPASLDTGPNPYVASDAVFVSVTVCAPGTKTCQTVDHVQIDTGSVGLRLFPSVLGSSLIAALPLETSATGNPVGECYGFIDGYIFGSVRTADVTVGGETVSGMPFELIADTSLPGGVPASCSSGGGSNINTVAALGANGFYGVGVTTTDCGTACTTPGGSGAGVYYDCPPGGCSTIIARAANTSAPFQQLPNPVAALATDNNGLIISLPAVAAAGAAMDSGTMYFGIGTQSNNALGSATVLATTSSSSPSGAGFVTATYNGQSLPNSFIDSGSNAYFFIDTSIPTCTASGFTGYYCPPSPLSLSASLLTTTGGSVAAPFVIYNAQTLFSNNNAALPGLGANPDLLSSFAPYPSSFDFGLPFFFGRNIYVAFEGRTAGGVAGPYFAY